MSRSELADAYLNVAESVFLTARCPLRPKDLIDRAYAGRLIPWHLHGARQDKTLQARISEDIARNPEGSRFFRTGPGTFFLRQFIDDPSIPSSFKEVFYAAPRKKQLRREYILSLDETASLFATRDQFVSAARLRRVLDAGGYHYRPYLEVLKRPLGAAVHSFVLVFHEGNVLSYRCGKFAPSSDPIYGQRSIGVGGAVYAGDRDLLFDSMHGIVASGINELGYAIGLPRHLARRARYSNEVRPFFCTLLRATEHRPAVAHVILAYRCPAEFLPSKAALSVNQLQWVSARDAAIAVSDYDETSRRLSVAGALPRIEAELSKRGR